MSTKKQTSSCYHTNKQTHTNISGADGLPRLSLLHVPPLVASDWASLQTALHTRVVACCRSPVTPSAGRHRVGLLTH